MTRHNCCVPLCKNHYSKAPIGTTWHFFPKNDVLRKQWIAKIRRDVGREFQVKNHMTEVCSAHFTPGDFRPIINAKRRYLKIGAVASIFPWSSQEKVCIFSVNLSTCKVSLVNIANDVHESIFTDYNK